MATWALLPVLAASTSRGKFVKVFPNEYKRALAEMYEREVELASAGTNAHVAMQPEAVAAK